MPISAKSEGQELLHSLTHRLETNPVDFVGALIDFLAAPERKREERLLTDLLIQVWLLLEYPGAFATPLKGIQDAELLPCSMSIAPYDRLIQVMCSLIEAQMILNWASPRQGKVHSSSNRTSQLFWGGLTLHIKLALPLEPACGAKLFSNGVVLLSNGKSFPCAVPFSQSQIYDLVTRLGTRFVLEYATAYMRNEQLRLLIASLNPKNNAATSKTLPVPGELLVQERSLNRYVDKFAQRLATHLLACCIGQIENPSDRVAAIVSSSGSAASIFPQIISEASSALCIPTQRIESLNTEKFSVPVSPNTIGTPNLDSREPTMGPHFAETENKSSIAGTAAAPIIKPSLDQVLEKITLLQQETIRDSIQTTFVPPILEYRDLGETTARAIRLNELGGSTNQPLVITAPPGGGKTRLQQELLLSPFKAGIWHLWIDLNQFSLSRIRSVHHFVANQFLNVLGRNRDTFSYFAEELIALEAEGKVHWHLEGWDEIPKSELLPVAAALAELSQFTLSSSNPMLALEILKRNGPPTSAVVTIQPFTQAQILEFIQTNLANQHRRKASVERRALQLPGMAQLPGGLEYLCSHSEHEMVVDTLLGFINCNLKRIGEPEFLPDELVFDGFKEVQWQSDVLASAYLLVKAIASRPKGLSSNAYSVQRMKTNAESLFEFAIDEIVPYMGATHSEQNRKLAQQTLDQAVRGKFLQVNDDGRTYHFVVPEVGCLLGALAILTPVHGRHWLERALKEFQQNPHDPIRQMTLALGAWHQETFLLQNWAFMTALGTAVPAKMAIQPRIPQAILSHSQG